MWTFVNGDIPEGMVVGHRCNNPSCINTNHMYLCTTQQNSSDAARDRLYLTGKDHHKFKVTDEMKDAMWDMYHTEGISQQAIAEIFNLSQSTVSEHIRNR